MVTCTHCNGQGKVHETTNSFFGTVTMVQPCKQCKGKGKIPKEKCQTCRGDGCPQCMPAGRGTDHQGCEEGK